MTSRTKWRSCLCNTILMIHSEARPVLVDQRPCLRTELTKRHPPVGFVRGREEQRGHSGDPSPNDRAAVVLRVLRSSTRPWRRKRTIGRAVRWNIRRWNPGVVRRGPKQGPGVRARGPRGRQETKSPGNAASLPALRIEPWKWEWLSLISPT